MELMRDVLHHVAEEETVVLPEAERLIPEQLEELGSKMTKRRMQLVLPRTADIALNMARALPTPSIAMLAGVAITDVFVGRRMTRP